MVLVPLPDVMNSGALVVEGRVRSTEQWLCSDSQRVTDRLACCELDDWRSSLRSLHAKRNCDEPDARRELLAEEAEA